MVTIKQIAAEVGISATTVSIVLGGKAEERKISAATQKKIFETANRLGYQPNIAARSLRAGFGADEIRVAMLWAEDFRASMMVRFWDGLRAELAQLDRKIRLVIYPYTNDHLDEVHALTSASDCHAAIICNASDADLEFLRRTQLAIPVVLYNRTCPGYCSVNVDDALMGALAARALSDQGSHRGVVLTGAPVFAGMEVRVQSFLLEGARHGLEARVAPYCDSSARGGYEGARALWSAESGEYPDALFCGSSLIAHGALRALRELGLPQLPRVVAIGNGAPELDELSVPSLSVVYLPMEEMARECLRLLMDWMSDRLSSPASRLLEARYIPRESCGPIADQEQKTID